MIRTVKETLVFVVGKELILLSSPLYRIQGRFRTKNLRYVYYIALCWHLWYNIGGKVQRSQKVCKICHKKAFCSHLFLIVLIAEHH